MNKIIVRTLLLIVTLAVGEVTVASPILSGSGVLGLTQNGSVYDVEFGDRGGATYLEVVQDPTRAILGGATFNGILLQIVGLLDSSALTPADIDGCSDDSCLIEFPVFVDGPGTVGGLFISYSPPASTFSSLISGVAQDETPVLLSSTTFGLITERIDVPAPAPAPATLALLGLGFVGLRLRRRAQADS